MCVKMECVHVTIFGHIVMVLYLLRTTKPHRHQDGLPRTWLHRIPVPMREKTLEIEKSS